MVYCSLLADIIDVAILNRAHLLKYCEKNVALLCAKIKVKIYSAEFRESTVKLANESDKPIAQTARELGVNESTPHTWINKYSRPLEPGKTARTDDPIYEELKRLKKENARLIEERDLLVVPCG